jgi:release factor glutamine methyltransferase
MKALEKLHEISKTLRPFFIESHNKEAEMILLNALDMNVIDIYRDDPELTDEQMSLLESVVSRRINREPLQYILGHVDFRGLRLHVGPGVLIPRPETELMAELAITRVGAYRNKPLRQPVTHHPSPITILDLCTGSGCLALALAKEFPDVQVFGIDVSEIALGYARRNADSNGINNITFLHGDLFEPLYRRGYPVPTQIPKHCTFDLIISNPPYIKSDDIKNLQTEIKNWEPINALDGGADGLDYYKMIIPSARQFLKPGGMLILELGIDCADAVKKMSEDAGYSGIELVKDYAGIERIAAGEWSGKVPAVR